MQVQEVQEELPENKEKKENKELKEKEELEDQLVKLVVQDLLVNQVEDGERSNKSIEESLN